MLQDDSEGGLIRALIAEFKDDLQKYQKAGEEYGAKLAKEPHFMVEVQPPLMLDPGETGVGKLLRVLDRLNQSDTRIYGPRKFAGRADGEFSVEWLTMKKCGKCGHEPGVEVHCRPVLPDYHDFTPSVLFWGGLIRHQDGDWQTHT
jgi:hypothetical protein